MRKVLKISSFILCLTIVICSLFTSVSADTVKYPEISISSHTAVPLDTITVCVNMDVNPGIMAMTLSVSYNKNIFTFIDAKGDKYPDPTIVDHPEKGYVSYVVCAPMNFKYTGSILMLDFAVKDKAAPGDYEITLKHIHPESYGSSLNGCFADWNRNTIIPTVTPGIITIGKTCNNVGHSFSSWKTIAEPTCTTEGVKTRSCVNCGHSETESISKIEHIFNDFWTVDRPASEGISGVMSRHCKNCQEVTDKKYFSLSQANKDSIPNKEEENVTEKDWKELSGAKTDGNKVSSGKDIKKNNSVKDSLKNEKIADGNKKVSKKNNADSDKKTDSLKPKISIDKKEIDTIKSADDLIDTAEKIRQKSAQNIIMNRIFSKDGILSLMFSSVCDLFKSFSSYIPVIIATLSVIIF